MSSIIEVKNCGRQIKIPIRAVYCKSFICQLKGLMFRSSINYDEGLLLVQSHDSRIEASIHMLFMLVDLSVIWIDSSYTVVDKIHAKRWKLAYFPQKSAKFILEAHVDRLNDFSIGDKVEFCEI